MPTFGVKRGTNRELPQAFAKLPCRRMLLKMLD
jgi:hypothetical protein